MKVYYDLLGMSGTDNQRWQKEFERICPRAVELKKSLQKSKETMDSLQKSIEMAKYNIGGLKPQDIEQLYESGKITIERKDEILNGYAACQMAIAQNTQMETAQAEMERKLKDELAPLVSEFVDKKQKVSNNSAVKIVKLIVGFVLGTIGYVIGFVLAGLLFELSNLFVILPATIDLNGAAITASALGANFLAFVLFGVVNKNRYHGIAFSIWLIVIAAFYLAACTISGEWHLVWYSICSFIVDGIMVAHYIKDNNE